MESRFEEMTKEQLLAELNVTTEKLKFYRNIEDDVRGSIPLSPHESSVRLAIAEARLAVFEEEKRRDEKKREFERRLAEATDFLKANGYEVRLMTAAERFPVSEEKMYDEQDMINFATFMHDKGMATGSVNPKRDFNIFIGRIKP